VLEHQRLRFVSIQRKKIIFSGLDPIANEFVRSRLLGAYVLLRNAASGSPQIRQALDQTDGIALQA